MARWRIDKAHEHELTRRHFLMTAGAAVAAAGLSGLSRPGAAAAAEPHLPPKAYPFALTTPENSGIPSSYLSLDPNSDAIRDMLVGAARRQRASLSRECTVYEVGSSDGFYKLFRNGAPWMHNGAQVSWRVPKGAQPGGGTDLAMMLQDEHGHPVFGIQRRLRGWKVSINHGKRTMNAANWSVCDYSRNGSPTPVYSSSVTAAGVPYATGCGREWAGLIRPEELEWALANGGTVSSPNVGTLKLAIRHCLRSTMGENLHEPNFKYRAPAVVSDSSGTGLLQMGMRLRLDPNMTDAEILARVPAKSPPGYRDRWQIFLWILLFAARDYGLIVADHTSPDLIVGQMEAEATAGWEKLLGTGVYFGEVIRDPNANATDAGNRPANAGLPIDRLQVPAVSVY